MYSRIRIYYKSKKISGREKEREKHDCWRCQVFIRENIIVSERRERGGKDAFQRMHFTKPQQPDVVIDWEWLSRKRVRNEKHDKRDKRRTSGGDGKERETERKRDRQEQREENLASKLQSSARDGDRRSPINERERRRRSQRLRRKQLRLLPTRYPREWRTRENAEKWGNRI